MAEGAPTATVEAFGPGEQPRAIALRFLAVGSVLLSIMLLTLPIEIPTALCLAAMVALAIVIDPFVGLLVIITSTYMQPSIWFAAVRKLHLVKLLSLLTLSSWVMKMTAARDFTFMRARQNIPLMFFCFSIAVSCVMNPADYGQLLLQVVQLAGMYVLIVNLVRTPRQIGVLVITLIAGAIVSSMLALYQYKSGGALFAHRAEYEGELRAGSTFGNPNVFALAMIFELPLCLGYFLTNRLPRVIRWACLGVALLLMAGVIVSFSRAGLVGTMLALAGSTFFVTKGHKERWTKIAILVLILVLLLPLTPPKYWQRAQTATDLQEVSINSRLAAWVAGANMAAHRPFTGVGLGQFRKNYVDYAPVWGQKTLLEIGPHSIYVEALAEMGFPGFIFFVLIIVASVRSMLEAYRSALRIGDPLLLLTVRAFFVSCGIVWIYQLQEHGILGFFFWLVAGLSAALRTATAYAESQMEGSAGTPATAEAT